MGLLARLSTGEAVDAVSMEDERLTLVSPRPFAPGQPVALEVAPADGGPALALDGKSLGSKRRADGRFDVRLRLVSLRRDARERLLAALSVTAGHRC